MSKKSKAAPVEVTIPTETIKVAVKAIAAAAKSGDAAIHALSDLDAKFPTMKAVSIAKALVNGGAVWSEATIRQELSRIRTLKKAGLWKDGMSSFEMRAELTMLKAIKDADKEAGTPPPSADAPVADRDGDAEKTVKRISKAAPDTIATALIDALIQAGVGDGDMDAILAEARRLVIAAVNAKKTAK